jgi:hypothetical protein|tara:strand:+ start:1155 stop:1280 length:126 start_codon:yes stop_codon:yes gene_type:complete
MVDIGQLGVGSVYLKERGEHGTLNQNSTTPFALEQGVFQLF